MSNHTGCGAAGARALHNGQGATPTFVVVSPASLYREPMTGHCGATRLRRYWAAAGLLSCLLAFASAEAQNCSKGKPCGNSCIARDKVCRVGRGTARWAPGADTTIALIPQSARRAARALDSAALHFFNSLPPTKRSRCFVASITDGDTFRCADGQRVRLLLIDAPERGQGAFGTIATSGLRDLIDAGDEVILELDIEDRDRYGRTLAYVYGSGGAMINEEMARLGLVLMSIYPPNVKHVDRIRAGVADARAAKRGLWATSAFVCPPAEYRRGRC